MIETFKPHTVFLPFEGDVPPITVLFSSLASRRSRPSGHRTRRAHPLLRDDLRERSKLPPSFIPNVFVDISGFLEEKIDIMNTYSSEIAHFPFPRSRKAIEALASGERKRDCQLAEAFMLMRGEGALMSVYIIAEAGVNHNGSLDMAAQLVDAAAGRGRRRQVPDIYGGTPRPKECPQGRIPEADHRDRREPVRDAPSPPNCPARPMKLIERCSARGIDFLSTPFDEESLDFLTGDLGLKTIKLGSGEVTNGPVAPPHRSQRRGRHPLHRNEHAR